MTKPLISVIVPVLNGASSLVETFESVLTQDYPHIELIVIDGGSIDGTLDIIKRYSSHISYWETGRDSGVSDAFNRGIRRATGELVAILNSDDYWEPDTFRHIEKAVSQRPDADIYYGQIRYLDPATRRTYVRSPDLSRMKQRMYLFHPSIFVRKSAYEHIGGYSEDYRFAMDSEWCHRAMSAGLKFQRIKHVLANMRLGGRSDTNFVAALREYRRSLLQHQIVDRLEADINFLKVLMLKILARPYYLRLIKQAIFR